MHLSNTVGRQERNQRLRLRSPFTRQWPLGVIRTVVIHSLHGLGVPQQHEGGGIWHLGGQSDKVGVSGVGQERRSLLHLYPAHLIYLVIGRKPLLRVDRRAPVPHGFRTTKSDIVLRRQRWTQLRDEPGLLVCFANRSSDRMLTWI